MSLADMEKRLEEIDQEVGQLLLKAVSEGKGTYRERLGDILTETTILKEKKGFPPGIEKDSAAARRMEVVFITMEQLPARGRNGVGS